MDGLKHDDDAEETYVETPDGQSYEDHNKKDDGSDHAWVTDLNAIPATHPGFPFRTASGLASGLNCIDLKGDRRSWAFEAGTLAEQEEAEEFANILADSQVRSPGLVLQEQ